MDSPESEASAANKSVSAEIELRVFEEAPLEHWPSKTSWADAMKMLAPYREHYMHSFDAPEKRLREKNPARFRLD